MTPTVVGVHPHARLFRLVDRARKSPVVWIAGPGGAGKTTLVASYLKARGIVPLWYQVDAGDNDVASFFYHMGVAAAEAAPRHRKRLSILTSEYVSALPVFTAEYFRELFARLKRPACLVLDNYQEAGADAVLHDVLCNGLEQIPKGVNVIVISREEPPGAMARLRASDRIAILGWEQLRLTEQEVAAVAKLRRKRTSLSRAAVKNLYEETQGWVAGVVLLTEQTEHVAERARPKGLATQRIFDYFAFEIFRRSNSTVQTFLLKTAYLPRVLPGVAAELTGIKSSRELLDSLTQRNYFTVRHVDGSYEYHPLFREFLTNRAVTTYATEELRDLKRRSAELLAADGDAETAIALLQQAEDWPGMLRLIVQHAGGLIGQGRLATVETWLKAVPESQRNKDPWALYWLGICRLPFAPPEARSYLTEAFALFERQDDATPLYLVWSKIIESYLFEMEDYTPMIPWLDRYASLTGERKPPHPGVERASIFNYVAGLTHARTDHPDLPVYADRAERFFRESDKERQLMQAAAIIPYFLWKGDVGRVAALVERLALPSQESDMPPLMQFNWYMAKSLQAGDICDAEEALKAIEDGLALADASGVHLMDLQLLINGIYAQLSVGNHAKARELFGRASKLLHRGPLQQAFYSAYDAGIVLHEGDTTRAIAEVQRAVEFGKAAGLYIGTTIYLVGAAFCYGAQGNVDSALAALAEVRPMAAAMQSKRFMSYCALAEANVHRLRGDRKSALHSLEEALSLARECGITMPVYCPRETAAILYGMALEADLYTDYVRATIARTRLPPPRDRAPENWPWPIRIYTLGKFSVIKNDQPLTFNERSRKKPRELLRQLIALGGKEVSVNLLLQALWPEAEGDMAKFSFKTTLYRLRQLIGEHTLLFEDGRLSLNAHCCWVDAWVLEHALGQDAKQKKGHQAALFNLYQGVFLPHDESPFVLLHRERLRSKFLREIARAGELLDDKPEEAIVWYQKGIEIDPLAEGLYRELMRCYQKLNRPAEALSTFDRCRAALSATLQVEPSVETRTLCEAIRSTTA